MNDTTPTQITLAIATVHKGTGIWRQGHISQTSWSGRVRNMRLSTAGVCIKLLTLTKGQHPIDRFLPAYFNIVVSHSNV
jgi:hypothetical protein